MNFTTISLKPLSLKLAGGLLAVAMGVTAMSGVASADAPPFRQNQLNCTPPACPMIDIRADLVAQNLSAQKMGDKLWVSFQIKNQGTMDAHSFKVRVYVNGQLARENSWVLVAAGNTVGETFANLPIDANAKLANVTVVLDPTNAVSESNEANNSLTQSFFF